MYLLEFLYFLLNRRTLISNESENKKEMSIKNPKLKENNWIKYII
jgi:hypothetical protein